MAARKKSSRKSSATPLQAAAGVAAVLAALSAWLFLPRAALTLRLHDGKTGAAETVDTHPNRYGFSAAATWLDGKAAKAMARGEFLAAEDLYTRSLAKKAENPRALIGRGSARIAQGRLEEAAADYRAAVDLEPAVAPAAAPAIGRAFYRRGRQAVAQRAVAAAERDLKRALALDPESAAALTELASLDILRRDYKACAAKLDRALELRPGAPDALANRGACRSALGRHREALADLDAAIAAGGITAEVLGTRAGVRLWLKDYAGALADAEKASAVDERIAPSLAPVIELARKQLAK